MAFYMQLIAFVNAQCHNFSCQFSAIFPMALSHALLAALQDSPCSGYDLAKKFDGSVGFFWSASHQQIYRELTKIEALGYIESVVVHQTSRPDKKVYQVTTAGQDYLRKWIATPATVASMKDDLLVKLFAGTLVEPEVILSELAHHRAQHQDVLDTYRSIEHQMLQHCPEFDLAARHRYLTLRLGIRIESEWLAWCDEAVDSITNLPNPLA
jgi:DNA-binding PadR family transcriptional regulator